MGRRGVDLDLLGERTRSGLGQGWVVVADAGAGVPDEPGWIPALAVALGGHSEGERRRPDGEGALRPVTELVPAADGGLAGDRAEQGMGEPVVLGCAGPVDRGAQVGPELAEPGDALDLVRAGEQVLDVGELVEAVPGVRGGDGAVNAASARRSAANWRIGSRSRNR